jgi:hypothetical protein
MLRLARRRVPAPVSHPAPPVVLRRIAVACAQCGGAASVTIALVLEGGRPMVEEVASHCPRCAGRA